MCSGSLFYKRLPIVWSKCFYLKLKGLMVKNILHYLLIGVVFLLFGFAQQRLRNTEESKIEAESYAQGLQVLAANYTVPLSANKSVPNISNNHLIKL